MLAHHVGIRYFQHCTLTNAAAAADEEASTTRMMWMTLQIYKHEGQILILLHIDVYNGVRGQKQA
jgi:hypothetical protein